jgi:hypothetical protein
MIIIPIFVRSVNISVALLPHIGSSEGSCLKEEEEKEEEVEWYLRCDYSSSERRRRKGRGGKVVSEV